MSSKLEGTITITKQEYFDLRVAKEILSRLEAGGVDNWEWYSESLYPDKDTYYGNNLEEADLEVYEENLRNTIEEM